MPVRDGGLECDSIRLRSDHQAACFFLCGAGGAAGQCGGLESSHQHFALAWTHFEFVGSASFKSEMGRGSAPARLAHKPEYCTRGGKTGLNSIGESQWPGSVDRNSKEWGFEPPGAWNGCSFPPPKKWCGFAYANNAIAAKDEAGGRTTTTAFAFFLSFSRNTNFVLVCECKPFPPFPQKISKLPPKLPLLRA